jgi:hypothetical protein
MMLGGLKFPLKDELPGQRQAHGPVLIWLVRIHPVALWLAGAALGLAVGLLMKGK